MCRSDEAGRLRTSSLRRSISLVIRRNDAADNITRFCFVRQAIGAAKIARQSLATMSAAEGPYIYPAGGTYHHPIAVALLSDDGAAIFYTTDGTEPTESSDTVPSGELIVIEESGLLRAIAAQNTNTFSTTSSEEVQATFVVYSTGEFCFRRYSLQHGDDL